MLDYIAEMTTKNPSRYGEYGSLECLHRMLLAFIYQCHLIFLMEEVLFSKNRIRNLSVFYVCLAVCDPLPLWGEAEQERSHHPCQ